MTEKNQLRIIKFLSTTEEATSDDIENILSLSQPEVALSLGELQDMGLVIKRTERHIEGKGRPIHIYKLKSNIQNIKEYYRAKIETESMEKIKSIFKYLNGGN